MRRATSGFTVLELMMVIAILGVLAAVAFPSFRYLSSSTKVKSASTELYLALIRARNEAVKRNRLVALTKNAAGWQAGWQIIADDDNDGAFTSADRMVHETGAFPRISITSAQDSVVFLTSGRIQGNVVPEIEVTSEETSSMQRCISADLTGKPYTKEGGC